ncbi:flagellar hook-associated protein FlgK, partial [bacterium DOLZORAL124_64_63]
GRGVEITGVRRIQDEFLLGNLRVQTARLASFTEIDSALYEVEAILGSVDNDHLGDALNNFFNSWNALGQPPINSSLKQDVISSALSLVNDFHSINDSLDDLEANIEKDIQLEIGNLNQLLDGVAEMNQQIMSAEASGVEANDLRDQRDLLITQISEIAEVSVHEREDGSKDIILAGRTMVARDNVTHFASTYTETSNGYKMTIVTQGHSQEVRLSPGKLEGLMTSRDVHIADVRDRLDSLAANLVTQVNGLHTQGRTSTSSGVAFFSGDSMHTIAVNPALENNPAMVATGTTNAEGDNTIALAIAALGEAGSGQSHGLSVGDEYRSLLTVVASKRSSYEFSVESQQNVVETLKTKMASVSGVSLDEEGANMIKFQNSYNAAARMISTVQKMYDTLINMV